MAGLQPDKTIVPIDFSDLSWSALDRAVEIAGDRGLVHMIHVLTPLTAMEPGVLAGTITDESRIEATEKYMREQLSERNYSGIVVHAVVGDAGRHIAAYAESEQADLIVLPSHGRSFVKKLLLGSVAERVIRLAHCPVLVLRQ